MLEYGKRNDMRSEVYNIDCMEYIVYALTARHCQMAKR